MNQIIRKFHLKDFPEDQIYVLLENKFRESYFKHVKEKFGTWDKIANFLQLSRTVMIQYSQGKRWIPLKVLNLLSKTTKLDLTTIEKHVISYRPYHGKSVKNPKIPILESPELLRILIHMIADGYTTLDKRIQSNYTNTSYTLIKNLTNYIQRVFGFINLTKTKDKRFNAWSIGVPKVIVYLVNHFYKIDFRKPRLPEILWNLPKEYTSSILGAFIDDEGSISESNIDISSSNLSLLTDLKNLLIDKLKFKEKSLSIIEGSTCLHLRINHLCFNDILDNAGIKHLEKYSELKYQIERRKNAKLGARPRNETRIKILSSISIHPKTTKGLAKELGIMRSNVKWHMKRLLNKDLVHFSKSKYGAELWRTKK